MITLILFISLLSLLTPSSIRAQSIGFFNDTEDVSDNQITTTSLDFSLQPSSLNFDSLTPDNPASQNFSIQKESGLDFNYSGGSTITGGDTDLCDAITLTAFIDSLQIYSGPLVGLTLPSTQTITGNSDDWQFTLSLGSTDPALQQKTCQFSVTFDAWQTDGTPATGFWDQEILTNTVTSGTWVVDTTPPTSDITSDEPESSSPDFPVDYEADDDVAVDYVELWYSHNFDAWNLFGTTDVPTSPGSFNFDSPLGDGLYEFYTLATDTSGNPEDDTGKTDFPYTIQVDSQNPYTNLSLGEFDQYRFAHNEQTKNGNFEDTTDASSYWIFDGQGQHQTVDDTDLAGTTTVKSGDNSALIGWLDADPIGDGSDYLYQTISVPDTTSTLSFWYQVLSDDTVDYDYFEAKIVDVGGTQADETIIQTGSDEVGGWWADSLWREVTYSLDNWLGSTVNLWFEVVNQAGLKTAALIDDVRVTTSSLFLTTDKEIVLDANDTGVGVDTTHFSLNGGSWQEYLGSFDLAGEGIGGSDPVDLDYYSVDFLGNTETTRSIQLSPDDTQSYFSIVLNIISPRPAGSDTGFTAPPLDGEWVELWNNSDVDIDVNGQVLQEYSGGYLHISVLNSDNNDNLSDTGETIVPAGGWLRVYRNGDSDFNLNDNGDTVKLLTDTVGSGGLLIDSYSYGPVATDNKVWRRTPDGTGTWSDPSLFTHSIILNRFSSKSSLDLDELIWLYNTTPEPLEDDNPTDDKFQPIDITDWKICHTDPDLAKYDPEDQENYNPDPTPDICADIKADINPDIHTADEDKTKISLQSEILFIIDLDLDQDKDTLFLLDDQDRIIDAYAYEDLEDNILFQRDSEDNTNWDEPEESNDLLQYYIYPSTNGPDLSLKIYGMPDSGQYQLEILYLSVDLEKGIFELHDLNQDDPDIIQREFFLGTCSADGTCTPDPQISQLNYYFIVNNEEQSQVHQDNIND